jgi:hypothetical protein
MLLHLPSNSLEPGGMLNIKNLNVHPQGMRKRSGTGPYSTSTVDYPEVQGVVTYWKTSGEQITFVIDKKFIYQFGRDSLAREDDTYSTGTVSVDVSTSDTTVNGTSTDWANNDIRVGDELYIPSTDNYYVIESVPDGTTLTTETAFPSDLTDVNYEIYRAFSYPEPFFLDWTLNGKDLIFADYDRPLRAFNNLDGFRTYDTTGDYKPGCVSYFNDRIFIGRTIESGDTKPQRIRWSGVGFSNHSTFAAENYIDLPYGSGYLMRLVPFSNFLVAYFADAIYLGRGTNNANIPVQFQKVESGGIGLVGMRAVASHLDGHFFVGQDDVYFLNNRGFERIGVPIVREMLENVDDKWNIRAATDPINDRVLFAVPYGGASLNRLYAYNYKSKAWSWMDVNVTSLDNIGLIATITWQDLTDSGVLSSDDWDTGFGTTWPTWESLSSSPLPERSLYFGNVGQVWYDIPGAADDNGTAIRTSFTTRDIDEQAPDMNKLWTRMTLKLEEPVESETIFDLEGSIDRGNTWKTLGPIKIQAGDDEGHVNFRLSGQLARFKFTSRGDTVAEYTIIEIVRRVTGKGLEVPGRSTG